MKFRSIYFVVLVLFSPFMVNAQPKQWLALGDSYTVAEGLSKSTSRWPNIAAENLLRKYQTYSGEPCHAVTTMVAQTGWTTRNLLAALQHDPLAAHYDLVTVMIGVNNEYNGRILAEYRRHMSELLDYALGLTGGAQNVIVMSIPDYTRTPTGRRAKEKDTRFRLSVFNGIAREEAENRGMHFVDISRHTNKRLSWKDLAGDKLHYSKRMHKRWAKDVEPLAALALDCAPR